MSKDLEARLRAPAYWISGSSEGHEGDNSAPIEAADQLERYRVALENLQISAQRVANKYGRDPVSDELSDWHEWTEVRKDCKAARQALEAK